MASKDVKSLGVVKDWYKKVFRKEEDEDTLPHLSILSLENNAIVVLYGDRIIIYPNPASSKFEVFFKTEKRIFCRQFELDKDESALIHAALYRQPHTQLKTHNQIPDVITNDINMDSAYICNFAIVHMAENGRDDFLFGIVLDAKDPKYALEYCKRIKDNPQMRQVILDSGDPEWAYWYCRYIVDDNEMRTLICNSGNIEWARSYYYNVHKDEEIKQVIYNSKKTA